jgi:hypothetical protein
MSFDGQFGRCDARFFFFSVTSCNITHGILAFQIPIPPPTHTHYISLLHAVVQSYLRVLYLLNCRVPAMSSIYGESSELPWEVQCAG